MEHIGPGFVAIVGSIIGLAIIAVLVSKNANTPAVFTGAGQALGAVIGAAVGPVSNSQANNLGSAGNLGNGSIAGAAG